MGMTKEKADKFMSAMSDDPNAVGYSPAPPLETPVPSPATAPAPAPATAATSNGAPEDRSFAGDAAARLLSNPAMYSTVLGAGIAALARPRAEDAQRTADAAQLRKAMVVGAEPEPGAPPPQMPRPERPRSLVAQAADAPNFRPGAGGGGGNIAALKKRYDDAVSGQFGLYGREQDLNADLAQQEVEKQSTLARLDEQQALEARQDALIQRRHDEAAAAKHEAFLARSEQLTDQLGAMKIDPQRLMRNQDAGHKFLFMLGGFLGGLSAGPNGTNQYLARVDKEIDNDIKAQVAEHENKKAQISARQSIFQQMMAETGDARLAREQTRKLMWEASKQHINATAARLGLPSVLTRGALINNEIDQKKIQPLKIDIEKQSYASAVAQANAAAAAEQARAKERRERFFATAKEFVSNGASEQEAMEAASRMDSLLYLGKEPAYGPGKGFQGKDAAKRSETGEKDASRFVATGQDPTTGKPTGYMAPTAEAAKNLNDSRASRAKMLTLLDRAEAIRKERGTLGRMQRGSPLFTPEWRNQLETIKAQMKLEYPSAISGAKRLNEKEIEIALEGLPDFETVGSSGDEKIKELRRALEAADAAERSQAAGQTATKLGDKSTVLGSGINAPPADRPAGQPMDGGIPSDDRAKQFIQKMRGSVGPMYSDPRAKAGSIALGGLSNAFANSGESGMNGAGGLVAGTISHVNADVSGSMRMPTGIVSDDRAKLDAAWYEGAKAARQQVVEYSHLPPDKLREAAEKSDLAYYVQDAVSRGHQEHADGTWQTMTPLNPPSNRKKLEEQRLAAPPPPPPAAQAAAQPQPYPMMLAKNNPNAGPQQVQAPPVPENGMSGPVAITDIGSMQSDPAAKRNIMSAKYAMFLQKMQGR